MHCKLGTGGLPGFSKWNIFSNWNANAESVAMWSEWHTKDTIVIYCDPIQVRLQPISKRVWASRLWQLIIVLPENSLENSVINTATYCNSNQMIHMAFQHLQHGCRIYRIYSSHGARQIRQTWTANSQLLHTAAISRLIRHAKQEKSNFIQKHLTPLQFLQLPWWTSRSFAYLQISSQFRLWPFNIV